MTRLLGLLRFLVGLIPDIAAGLAIPSSAADLDGKAEKESAGIGCRLVQVLIGNIERLTLRTARLFKIFGAFNAKLLWNLLAQDLSGDFGILAIDAKLDP